MRNDFCLTLCCATRAASIPSHRHGLLLLLDIFEICKCTLKLPAVDSLRRLASVLERDTEVRASCSGRLGGCDWI